MCAIAGILDLNTDEQILGRMLSSMENHGIDGKGGYRAGERYFLHTRLSVVDPVGGGQPMVLDWGNERYVMIYNGELFNTEELRTALLALGHQFYGHSDTEVLLHGYAQWNDAVLEKCNGVFALAIMEEHSGTVFLARDRIGVKSLFYAQKDRGLLFASEMKYILTYPGMEAKLDGQGAAQLLLLGPGRAPGSGIFHGILELEPGCCAKYRNGRLQIRRYWHLQDREHGDSFEQTAETVRYLVKDAVERQMVADVPVGAFLSGGLDSSLVCSICARKMERSGNQLHTFSLDYEDNDKYFQPDPFQPNMDTEYIRIMQSHLDTVHHWTVLKPEDLTESLTAAMVARDLPGMADVDTSLLQFCGQIRPHIKVALSGECADEIFGGYPWFRDPNIRNEDGFPWSRNLALRSSFLHPWIRETLDSEEFVMTHYRDSIAQCDILPGTAPEEKRMKEMVNLNFRWFMQTLLERGDRMGMYHGLEIRMPFCDYRIVEYMYGVPWQFKDYRGREKGLLRYAMEGILPQSVLYRKKSPYPKTHDPRYTALVSTMLEALLEDPDAPIFDLVPRQRLKELLTMEFTLPWYGQLMRRPQTMAYMLQLDLWMRHYRVQLV